jgi:hypothetical protein
MGLGRVKSRTAEISVEFFALANGQRVNQRDRLDTVEVLLLVLLGKISVIDSATEPRRYLAGE